MFNMAKPATLSPEVLAMIAQVTATAVKEALEAAKVSKTSSNRKVDPKNPTVVYPTTVDFVEYENDNRGRSPVQTGKFGSGPYMVTVWSAEQPADQPIKFGEKFLGAIGGWTEIKARETGVVIGYKARYQRVVWQDGRGWVKYSETSEGLAEKAEWAKRKAA